MARTRSSTKSASNNAVPRHSTINLRSAARTSRVQSGRNSNVSGAISATTGKTNLVATSTTTGSNVASTRPTRNHRSTPRIDSNAQTQQPVHTTSSSAEELIITRNISSTGDGDSQKPWKMNKSLWDKLSENQREVVKWLQLQNNYCRGAILHDNQENFLSIAGFLRSVCESRKSRKGISNAFLIVCHSENFSAWKHIIEEWVPNIKVFVCNENSSLEDAFVMCSRSTLSKHENKLKSVLWEAVFIQDDRRFPEKEIIKQFTTKSCFIFTNQNFQNEMEMFFDRLEVIIPLDVSGTKKLRKKITKIFHEGIGMNMKKEDSALAYECLVAFTKFIQPLVFFQDSDEEQENKKKDTKNSTKGKKSKDDEALDKKVKVEEKQKRKTLESLTNKLAKFEDKKLLNLFINEATLKKISTAFVSCQNMNIISNEKKIILEEAISIMKASKLLTAYKWKQQFHREIMDSKMKPIMPEYFVEQEEMDPFWNKIYRNIYTNAQEVEINNLIVFAQITTEYLNGAKSVKRTTLENMWLMSKLDKFYVEEIISTLAIENRGVLTVREKYRNVKIRRHRKERTAKNYTETTVNRMRR